MAYNFATGGYHSLIKASPGIDTDALRAEVIRHIQAFDPKSWYDAPLETLLRGEYLRSGADSSAATVDAFGKENGRQVLASTASVDKVIAHVQSFRVSQVDLRDKVRSIEDVFFKGPLTAEIVAHQALDFHKQDGITEIEESVQALLVERQLNDALFADEREGKVVIGRQAAFVGCVSNFTNFLDLCRKILRNMELGVPVVVLSRSNTTQHMYRYVLRLLDLMRERGLDLGLCTYCSCSIEEQRRLLAACEGSPMYFTGSREVAARIKEVAPRLMASTGGPNTMVVGQGCFTKEVAAAARMSNLIEHKGQCTALRHLVLPGASEADVQAIYSGASCVSGVEESLQKKEFSAQLKGLAKPLAEGYSLLKTEAAAEVAVRHCGEHPPKEIDEQWREAYLDVTAPRSLNEDFLGELTQWLNREQPISLALNCDFALARRLFEATALVVYTVGRLEKHTPALTAQARPQDGECFGEFPPRRQLASVTAFPVIIPSSTPGYNTAYAPAFLQAHGAEPVEKWAVPGGLDAACGQLVNQCSGREQRGYCRVLLEYLADATRGPHRGCGARTSLFGLQRPPLEGGTCCVRLEEGAVFDEAVQYILPFAATTARDQLTVSAAPSCPFAIPGVKVVKESKEDFAKSESGYWNVITLPLAPAAAAGALQFPLAAHFVSKLFAMGHVKSTLSDDTAFLEAFSASPKWLRMAGAQAGPRSKM